MPARNGSQRADALTFARFICCPPLVAILNCSEPVLRSFFADFFPVDFFLVRLASLSGASRLTDRTISVSRITSRLMGESLSEVWKERKEHGGLYHDYEFGRTFHSFGEEEPPV